MHPKFKDLTGLTFGKLSVIALDPLHSKYPQKFMAKCECGSIRSYFSYSLTSGGTQNCKSCGYKNSQKVSDDRLIESYNKLHNVWKVADEVGLCGQSVHERLSKIGVQTKMNYFTDGDVFYLREHYTTYLLKGKLSELAKKMGRSKTFICIQAKELGLTDISRKKKLLENFKPNITKETWLHRPHPKSNLGKHPSAETREKMSISNRASQLRTSLDVDKRAAITKKILETKYKNGTFANHRPHTTWKSGWREIGGKKKYFRSRWEANYARYLEFLKGNNQIIDWQHEPKVFWFEGIKRGCVSYLPDFSITEKSGEVVYHEVKGWMDDRSKTKIRRMSIYFPEVKLQVIDAKWFKANNRNLTSIIYGWET